MTQRAIHAKARNVTPAAGSLLAFSMCSRPRPPADGEVLDSRFAVRLSAAVG
jgi:hypothetical protein